MIYYVETMNRNEGISAALRMSLEEQLAKNRAKLEEARKNNDVKRQEELATLITQQERALVTMGNDRSGDPKP